MPRHPVILNANEVRNHDPVKAAEIVEELILNGDSTAPAGGAYDLLGQIYLEAGDLLSAKDSFSKNLEIYPDSDGTFCYMGLIEQILGDSAKAQEWYGKCPDRGFDPPFVDTIRSTHTKWQAAHPDAISRIALIITGTKPPSLKQKNTTSGSGVMEKCPKCGRKEPKLTVVIDHATMSQKLLCSQCARATTEQASIGINMPSSPKKWWQFW